MREVIGRRLDSLTEPAQRTLTLAAVLGRGAELNVLERLAKVDADTLEALDEAVAAGLLREEPGTVGRYVFGHALVRETLYVELTATRRARLHARAAQVLIDLDGSPPDRRLEAVILHLLKAAPPATPRWRPSSPGWRPSGPRRHWPTRRRRCCAIAASTP